MAEVFYAAINMVSMMNQYNMLARVIADEELFGILKEIYSQVDNMTSVRLYLGALRRLLDHNRGERPYEEWLTAFCQRKYQSDFSREMTRSVAEYLTQYKGVEEK